MSAIARYFSALALVSTCLFPIAAMSGAPSARNQSRELMVHSDEVTVRELTAKYYYAFESYGCDIQSAMWSPNSKDPAAELRDKARAQAAMTHPKIEKLDILRVMVEGDRAIVLAKVLLTTFRKDNGKPVGGWYRRGREGHIVPR